jgi:hypothetical protein
MSVISLSSIIHAKKQAKMLKLLDVEASYVALDTCLRTLNINDLEELEAVKRQIKKTMKKLEEVKNNG